MAGAGLVVAGFFVVRTPLLPACEFPVGESVDGGLRLAAVAARCADPVMREALEVAAPSLAAELAAVGEGGVPSERAAGAVYRYLSRASWRATPFGLFAGTTIGLVGDAVRLELPAQAAYTRTSRVDPGLVLDARAQHTSALAVDGRLLVANPSCLQVGERLRYFRSRPGRPGVIVSLRWTPRLAAALEATRDGAPLGAVVDAVASTGFAPEAAAALVEELIAREVLVGDGPVGITTAAAASVLAAALGDREVGVLLRDAQAGLERIDASPFGTDPGAYTAVRAMLAPLTEPDRPLPLVTVDLRKPGAAVCLPGAVIEEIAACIPVLERCAPEPAPGSLGELRRLFEERYGEREVPLLEAIDGELGIDIDGALGRPERPAWSSRDDLLLSLIVGAARRGEREIVLDDALVERLPNAATVPLPNAFAILATLVADGAEAVASGDWACVIHGVAGPSGARLLGRFCATDPDLAELVFGHLAAEEALDPDADYAEVVSVAASHEAAFLARPPLRRFEIEYAGCSTLPISQRIPARDLLVSLVDDRFVLRSARTGRRVVARITSAFNIPIAANPCLRFLGAIQADGVRGWLRWDWGLLASAPYRPRVRRGRLVLACARWRTVKEDLAELSGAPGRAALRRVLAERGVPRVVQLEEGDNRLVLDTDDDAGCDAVLTALRRVGVAELGELYPGPDELVVSGPEGRFAHELVIPFTRHAPVPPVEARRPERVAAARRSFAPGSDWLYLKLYAGQRWIDRLLRTDVAPLVGDVLGRGDVDRWFFVRYADPAPHVRLRLHAAGGMAAGLLPSIERRLAPLIDDGRIHRILLDTYEREIDRYGGSAAIELVERVFQADSCAVLAGLAAVQGDRERRVLCLVGIDLLLADLGLDTPARLAAATRYRDALHTRLAPARPVAHLFAASFREDRAIIDQALDRPDGPAADALRARGPVIREVAATLRHRAANDLLTRSMDSITHSIVHMHANRALAQSGTLDELRCYDALVQIYQSQIARR
jgi:thiopeptide-type bacteriocin biosynthesis protein